MKSLTIVVPGRPPGANDLIRMGHWRIAKVRTSWKVATVEAISLPESWEVLKHCHVSITWRCKVRRRRDFDNLVSGLKPLLDGLVAGGVIEDDDTSCVMLLGPLRVEVGAERDETIMEVTECDPDGIIWSLQTPVMEEVPYG